MGEISNEKCQYDGKKCDAWENDDTYEHESGFCRYGSWENGNDPKPCNKRYDFSNPSDSDLPIPSGIWKYHINTSKKLKSTKSNQKQKLMPFRMMNESTDRKKSKSIGLRRKPVKKCKCK